jgi:hypothetical protein
MLVAINRAQPEAVVPPDPVGEKVVLLVLSSTRSRHRLGAERQARRPGRLGVERALASLSGLLVRLGYEPSRPSPRTVQFRTCPFPRWLQSPRR